MALSFQTLASNLFRLEAVQQLPIDLSEAWAFFSDPRNLQAITPPELNLAVTNALPPRMHAGMIVTYRVRPLLGLPVNWMTEITHVEEGRLFVDEQRFGPYRFWHHQHHFEADAGGTRMRDIVHYALPLGPLSRLANTWVVCGKLEAIFRFRAEVLERRFGLAHEDAP